MTLLAGGVCAAPAGRITFDEHVLPVLRNSCLNCHNPDKKKADFDASSYSAIMAGGGSGKVLAPEDPQASLLWRLVTHAEEPAMPPKGPRLPDADLEILKRWIEGGLPENSGSKVAAPKPTAAIESRSISAGRPSGPPPMPNGDLILEPVVHATRSGAVAALATSPWAPLVAIAAQHQVLLYNTDSLALEGIIPFPEGFPYVVRFSRSGRLLLIAGGVGGKLGRAALHEVITGRRVGLYGDEFDAVLAADISPDQARVALGGPGKRVRIYATATGELVHTLVKHTDWITAIQYSPDGVLLATADRSGGLHLWEAESAGAYGELRSSAPRKINDLAWRDDSNVLASASEDGQIQLWDAENLSALRKWNAHAGGTERVRFAHDGRLVTAGRDRMARLWDAAGKQIRVFEGLGDIALAADLSHDGLRVLGGDFQGDVRVWNTTNGVLAGGLDLNPPTLQNRLQAAQGQWANAVSNAAPLVELEKREREIHRWRVAQFNTRVWDASDQLARAQVEADAAGQRRREQERTAAVATNRIGAVRERIQKLPELLQTAEGAVAGRVQDLTHAREVHAVWGASYQRALRYAGASLGGRGDARSDSAETAVRVLVETLARQSREIREARRLVAAEAAQRDALKEELRNAGATQQQSQEVAKDAAREAQNGRVFEEKARGVVKERETTVDELRREYRRLKGGS